MRPASAAIRARGLGLRDPGRAAHGRVLELFGEARRNARARAAPRLADGVLHAPRASGATTLSRRGPALDGAPPERDPDRGGRLRRRVLRAATAQHGAGVCETGWCGVRNAE